MSNLTASPELIASAAEDLAAIGANVDEAHAAAASSTLAVPPAAADEVSVSVADFFSRHARDYQARAGQAAAFGEQFVQHLSAGAGAYAGAEAANAAVLAPAAAAAGPITNAITAVWGDIQNFLNSALTTFEQILNQYAGFLIPLIQNAIAFSVAFFFGFVLPAVEIALNILVVL
ncbi:PE family protein [Mycobacterium sp. Marseille-P9652]|uniref:PE family protein n=1 Tax=Mycobacterium sp. Marseille-P9652 TaxID=2654950 RepID=UPI0012E9795A|nr:PE family protein [Mycobacterium sp. Marseille-P9652]